MKDRLQSKVAAVCKAADALIEFTQATNQATEEQQQKALLQVIANLSELLVRHANA